MRHRLLLVPVILAVLGADWAQFRGPGGAGVSDETGLPAAWSSQENIVWRTKLPGPGTSSPIVVGKRIYLTCYTGYGEDGDKGDMDKLMRHLVCIDTEKGDILWTKDFAPSLPESKYEGGNNTQHGYSSSTPASDGKRLYVFFGKSGVYCLDLDGKEIWRQSVGTNTHGWGSSNSPVLYRDLVIINASVESDSLVALDKDTGKEVWRVKNIRESWNTPVLVDVPDGGIELVVNESAAVIGFDPADGKELWRVTGFSGYVCPSVVTHKGVVYAVRGEALAIRAGGRGDVTQSHVLWHVKGSSLVSSPVYHEGHLYWPGGTVFCLDAATGKEVYNGRLSENASFYASPLVADGKLYCVSRFHGTFVLPTGAVFKELGRNKFADDASRTNASPIANNGRILMRTDRYLYAIGEKPAQVKEPELQRELLRRTKIDQEARNALIKWMNDNSAPGNGDPAKLSPEKKAEYEKLGLRVGEVDEDNTKWLEEAIKKHGWPGTSLVGKAGAGAAWLLVQHADAKPKFQRLCLDLMKKLPKEEVSQSNLAYLTDRVLLAEGKKQIYGTQFTTVDGKLQPRPLEDEVNVDKRRAEVGLPPLAEYRKSLERLYGKKKK